MTPHRHEPPAVDVSARPPQRECRTVITAPKGALLTGWRNAMVKAIDEIAADFRGVDEYHLHPIGSGLRLVVESLAGYDAGDIARAIKLRALRRCAS